MRHIFLILFLASTPALVGCPSDGLGRFKPVGTCTPSCAGRECGTDGCNGTCGTCRADEFCDPLSGQCIGDSEYLVTGTIELEYFFGDVVGGSVKLVGPDTVPGTGLLISIVDEQGVVTGAGRVQGIDGQFSIPVNSQPTGTEKAIITAVWADDGGEVLMAVMDPLSDDNNLYLDTFDPYVWYIDVPAGGSIGHVTVEIEDGSGALFVFMMNKKAFETIVVPLADRNLDGDVVPLAIFYGPWSEYTVPCTCYHGVKNTIIGDSDGPRLQTRISIVDNPGDSSAWGWAVLFHEFGHYVLDCYAKDTNEGGAHYLGQTLKPEFAFSEGWATFMSLVTATSWFDELWPFYWDIQNGSWFFIDFEQGFYSSQSGGTRQMVFPELSSPTHQDLDENWVARTLYMIWDQSESSDNPDEMMTLEQMLDTVASERFLRGIDWAPDADLYNFLDSALCLFPEKDPALADRMVHEFGFPYAGDPRCTKVAAASVPVRGPGRIIKTGSIDAPAVTRSEPRRVGIPPVVVNGVLIDSAIRLKSSE